MKKIICILIITIFSIGQSYSQDKPYRLFATIGIKPVNVSAEGIYISYVDESPSMDNLQSDVSLKNSSFTPSLELGIEYELSSHLLFKCAFDAHIGQFNGVGFDFGLGYSIPISKIIIRPLLMFTYGASGIKLGDIYQNDLFIEVNNTQFYSESVGLSLSGGYFQVNPKIEFALPLNSNEDLEIRFNIGYNHTLSQKTVYLSFSGQDETDVDVSAKESISANNVYLRIDNERVTKPFIGLDGIHAQFGIAYKF